MDGLIIYKEYLNSMLKEISNYSFSEIKGNNIQDIMTRIDDIDDLLYLDDIFCSVGLNIGFFQSKNYLENPVTVENKLLRFFSNESEEMKRALSEYLNDFIALDDSLIDELEEINDFFKDSESLEGMDISFISQTSEDYMTLDEILEEEKGTLSALFSGMSKLNEIQEKEKKSNEIDDEDFELFGEEDEKKVYSAEGLVNVEGSEVSKSLESLDKLESEDELEESKSLDKLESEDESEELDNNLSFEGEKDKLEDTYKSEIEVHYSNGSKLQDEQEEDADEQEESEESEESEDLDLLDEYEKSIGFNLFENYDRNSFFDDLDEDSETNLKTDLRDKSENEGISVKNEKITHVSTEDEDRDSLNFDDIEKLQKSTEYFLKKSRVEKSMTLDEFKEYCRKNKRLSKKSETSKGEDDLAKLLIGLTLGVSAIPKKTQTVLKSLKINSDKVYQTMKVDEDEDEDEDEEG